MVESICLAVSLHGYEACQGLALASPWSSGQMELQSKYRYLLNPITSTKIFLQKFKI